MANNNITYTLGQGGLGRPLAGQDYISSMVFYGSTVPSGFTSSTAIKLFSVAQAESLGIVGDYSDETKALCSMHIGATGSAGSTVGMVITENNINSTTNVVNIGTYTTVAADTTDTTFATNLATFISNSGTNYTATATGATLSVSARTGLGASINTKTITLTNSGVTVTAGTFSGGITSKLAPIWYQISEYFRQAPQGNLWTAFFATPNTYNFNELKTVMAQANNEIRQFGVYSDHGTSTSLINADLDALQVVAETFFDNYSAAQIIYSSNMVSISDLSTLTNLQNRSDNYVSCVIGQDGGALGAWLAFTSGKSVPTLGAALGAVSLSKVSEDIGWVGKFNLSNGTELEVPAFANGQLFSTLNATLPNLLDQLTLYKYIYIISRPNKSGTYFVKGSVAISDTSDYYNISNNRVINKAMRNSYLDLVNLINSSLVLKSNGQLSNATVATFKNASTPSLDAMKRNSEISDYAIIIDPTQNVQTTSSIDISIKLVGIGIANKINVTIGFTLSI